MMNPETPLLLGERDRLRSLLDEAEAFIQGFESESDEYEVSDLLERIRKELSR